ncbi:MAG: glycosyltransferase family 4 protein [Rubrobacteridae bacterium]|nr:glycosyltransferase family 4 protein [Rubrobacteridae bacterium]
MLGWELPPYHSGGLGRACEGMTKGLTRKGVGVSFVLPKKFSNAYYDWMNVHDASEHALGGFIANVAEQEMCIEFAMRHKCALMSGYQVISTTSEEIICRSCFSGIRAEDLSHVSLYSKGVLAVARNIDYNAIHAHDWMTFPAAINARKVAQSKGRNVPFIAHVHATEIDRHDGSRIYSIEKRGMQAADRIIAVSNYTKETIAKYYGIDPNKIMVVHNGIEPREIKRFPKHPLKRRYKIVLFIGRITYQKGPDYYVRLAKRITDQYPNVKFLMVGSGDMQSSMVEMAAHEGLTGKLMFSSWINDKQMDAAYQMADVFVMPSVSEPFGIVPLESIQNGTPVVVSKNSGFVEVVHHCFAVDFWDIDKMARAIVTLLKNEPYARAMVEHAQREVRGLTWDVAADKLVNVYDSSLRSVANA